MYQYVQLFVISNGTHTKYYSNTTRFQHIKDNAEKNAAKKKKTSNSFEFTSYWADEKNRTIPNLVDFTKTFFAKHTLLNILTRYGHCLYQEFLQTSKVTNRFPQQDRILYLLLFSFYRYYQEVKFLSEAQIPLVG